jgi:hypothetical protein
MKASGGDTLKCALYGTTATLTKATTAYATSGELSSSGTGYTTGGATMTGADAVLSGDTAYTDFADVAIGGATFTTYGALIYNSSKSNRAIMVLDFGGAQVVTGGGTFTIVFPTPAAGTAIITLT